MKPFDLEAAKKGAPVCTRDGEPVRIICFDRKYYQPIVALVLDKEDGMEYLENCSENGQCLLSEESGYDLMMVEE